MGQTTNDRTVKLALAQMLVTPGEIQQNLARAEEFVSRASKAGAEVVLLPEALPFGWMELSALDLAEEIPSGKHCQYFAELATRYRIHLCTGLVERSGANIFNAAVLLSPDGEVLLHHRKIYELGIAHACYALGDRLGVVDTPMGRLGLMICADGFAPSQAISRTLALMGAQLILSPSAWAVPPEHENRVSPYGKLWIDNYGAVTRDFNCWIAGCSNVGPITSGQWAGHRCIGCSLVVGPNAEIRAIGKYGETAEQLIVEELELKRIERASAD